MGVFVNERHFRPLRLFTVSVVLIWSVTGFLLPAASSAQPAPDGEVTLQTMTAPPHAYPGQDVTYTFDLACSALRSDCIAPVFTAVIPWNLGLASIPESTAERNVTYHPAAQTLTVAYVIPLASPANPDSPVGMPAGSRHQLQFSVRIPPQPEVDPGIFTTIATFGGDNTNNTSSSPSTTIEVPDETPDATTPDGDSVLPEGSPTADGTTTKDTPLGSVYVAKQVTGPGARFLPTEAPFPAAYSIVTTCERPVEDGFEPLFTKRFLLLAGERWLVSDEVPIGSRCWGEEEGSFGATRATVVPGSLADAAVVTVEEPEVTVTATNDYQVGRVEVRKSLIGGSDNGPFDIRVICFWRPTGVNIISDLPEGIPVALPNGGSLQVSAGAAFGYDVPVPSTCTVTESNVPEGFIATYDVTSGTPGERAGEVTITRPGETGSVVVVNTYAHPAPQTLPATGADFAGKLPLSVLVTAVGGLLTLTARRRIA